MAWLQLANVSVRLQPWIHTVLLQFAPIPLPPHPHSHPPISGLAGSPGQCGMEFRKLAVEESGKLSHKNMRTWDPSASSWNPETGSSTISLSHLTPHPEEKALASAPMFSSRGWGRRSSGARHQLCYIHLGIIWGPYCNITSYML